MANAYVINFKRERFTDSEHSEDELPKPTVVCSPQAKSAVNLNDSEESFCEDDGDIYIVERLVGKRKNPETGLMEYRVKWENYTAAENTWEPAKNIHCMQLITDFEAKEANKKKNRIKKEETRKQKYLQKKKEREERQKNEVKKPRTIYRSESEEDTKIEFLQAPEISGFKKGYSVDRIVGASRHMGLHYLVKFEGVSEPELVDNLTCRTECPQKLISYFEKIACVMNN